MLGTDLCQELAEDYEAYGADLVKREASSVKQLVKCDITNEDETLSILSKIKPDLVIHTAAWTDVDGCELGKDKAYKINSFGAENVALGCKQTGAALIYISTDFVFDGASDKPYTEKDIPRPINAYGRTKLAGERLLVENHCHNCIMRVEWTYGMKGDNFIKKILQKARTLASAKPGETGQKDMKIVDDQIGSPTATTEAAKAVCDLIHKKPTGIYHFASQGYVSRFDVAQFIAEKLALDVRLTPCKTSDYPSAAARPLSSKFNCSKIRPLLSGPIKPWRVPLEEFLKQL